MEDKNIKELLVKFQKTPSNVKLYQVIKSGKLEEVKVALKDYKKSSLNEAVAIAAGKKKWKILKYIISEHQDCGFISTDYIKIALKSAKDAGRYDIVELLNTHLEKTTFMSALFDNAVIAGLVSFSKAIVKYLPTRILDTTATILKPVTNLCEKIADKAIRHLPIAAESQGLAQNIIRSSVPLVIIVAVIKGIYTFCKEWRRGVSLNTIAKDTAYVTGEALVEGGSAAICASIATAAVTAVGVTGFVATAVPFVAACTAGLVTCGAINVMGHFTNKIMNQREAQNKAQEIV